MSTDLFRFQIKLLGEGYVQVPKAELRTNTFAIEGTDVLVNDGDKITRNMFIEDGSYFDKYVEAIVVDAAEALPYTNLSEPSKKVKTKSKVVLDVSPDLTTQIDNSTDVEISNDTTS